MSRLTWQLLPQYPSGDTASWLLLVALATLGLEAYEVLGQRAAAPEPISSDLCLGLCDGRVERWTRHECQCVGGAR